MHARSLRPGSFAHLCVDGKAARLYRMSFTMEVAMSAPFKLAPLPWDEDALAPTISSSTISFHYHKHHQTYVDTLNKLVEKTKFADMKLEQIVQTTHGASEAKEKQIFNNAAQVWNHDFYWRSLTPAKTEPSASWTAPSPPLSAAGTS